MTHPNEPSVAVAVDVEQQNNDTTTNNNNNNNADDDVSSDVTSLSPTTIRSQQQQNQQQLHVHRRGNGDNGERLVATARQLIVDLQTMLPAKSDDQLLFDRPSTASRRKSADRQQQKQQSSQSTSQSGKQKQQQQQRQSSPIAEPLELQACNGLCLVFANYSVGHCLESPTDDSPTTNDDEAAAEDHRQRAGQIRDTAEIVGQLFNSRLEFTVLIHWNKSQRETLQLLRQAATMMSDNRDCCFAFFLGRGGPGHFEAACGGQVALVDILATLAVGQRARLPVFVVGELTSPAASTAAGGVMTSARPNLPSNQLLLWTLGVPQAIEMMVEQLTRSHLSGGKDVASTVAGIAEWIRRRRVDVRSKGCGGCSCRFLSKLDRLVYLASPDCI